MTKSQCQGKVVGKCGVCKTVEIAGERDLEKQKQKESGKKVLTVAEETESRRTNAAMSAVVTLS